MNNNIDKKDEKLMNNYVIPSPTHKNNNFNNIKSSSSQ